MNKQYSYISFWVFENIATDLLKMVYGQPYLPLGIEHTAQVAPSHCEVGLSLNGFQVARLDFPVEKATGKEENRWRGKV